MTDTDDLSDVIITTPTPVNYSFTEVWHADIIARAVGYTDGGGERFVRFLTALAEAYDQTRHLADLDADWSEGTQEPARKAEIASLLAAGESMVDMADLIGDSHARVMATITSGQPTMLWVWSERRWAEWEDAINRTPIPSSASLGREFALDWHTVNSLLDWYGKTSLRSSRKEMWGRIKEIILANPTLTARQIAEAIRAEGHTVDPEAVRKHRQRHQL